MRLASEGRTALVLVGSVLFVAALARLAASTVLVPAWEKRTGRPPFPDLYPTLAASLVDSHRLGYAPRGAPITTGRGPAFPAWLALPMLAGVQGDRWMAWWATLPGLFGGALAAYACVRFRPPSFPPSLAAAAAGLAALHPLPMFVSARGMSDKFCGVLGLAAIAAFCLSQDSPRGPALWVAGSGIALAIAILARATSVLFLIALLGTTVIARLSYRRMIAVSVLALLPALGWSIRSSVLEGRPVFVHSLGAYNFWLAEASDRFGFSTDDVSLRAKAHALMTTEGGLPREVTARLWHAALTPPQTASLVWFWIRAESWTTTLRYTVVAAPFLLLAGLGAWVAARTVAGPFPLALLLAIALHVAFYAAVCPMARYSVVVYPSCAYLATLGVARSIRRA